MDNIKETDIQSLILDSYQIRKTKSQKTAFIEMLKTRYGDKIKIEQKRLYGRNIVIGDPEKADVIFTAHYDTCAKMIVPNVITPQNMLIYIAYQLVISLIFLIPVFAASFFIAMLTDALLPPDLSSFTFLLSELAGMGVLVLVCWLLLAGPQNHHTANDNTSGVITVLRLFEKIGTDTGAAFILFDNEEKGLLGSSFYATTHKNVQKNGFVINLDCVSDGDYMFFIHKTAKKSESGERGRKIVSHFEKTAPEILAKYNKTAVVTNKGVYPSDQAMFKNGVGVAFLNKTKGGTLYMDKIHTENDRVFMKENIDALVELFSAKE